MEWYLPMTIIPGIGLIILSTSNIMLSLNKEISELLEDKNKYQEVIAAKLSQLIRTSYSIVFQYIGVLLFLFSGISRAIYENNSQLSNGLLIAGVIAISISIIILLIYSIKAIGIKRKHLEC